MKIDKERRERWAQETKNDAFNTWLRPLVSGPDGTLDLDRLYNVAKRYGLDLRENYVHLNPGQQRMNVGKKLRAIVPPHDYEEAPVEVPTSTVERPYTGTSIADLLRMHGAIQTELRLRGVIRTANNPVGDYAELLFSKAFGWGLESSSTAGYDATDHLGVRYQIKSRRLTRPKGSRQLSFLRDLPARKFDFLAAVLFDEVYRVQRAVILPHECLESRSRFSSHANGWLFRLDDECWSLPGARDVYAELCGAAERLSHPTDEAGPDNPSRP